MNSGLRKHLNQLPYFLMYNYPKKMATYLKTVEINKNIEDVNEKKKLNAYHSPSPMNELCDYINMWEKKHILWDNPPEDIIDVRCLVVNNDLQLDDKRVIEICKKYIKEYLNEIKEHIKMSEMNPKDEVNNFDFETIVEKYRNILRKKINLPEEIIANYVIDTSYSIRTRSKFLAWSAYGDYIIENLKNNTNPKRNISIREVPYKTKESYEYLGKYYEFEVGDSYVLR